MAGVPSVVGGKSGLGWKLHERLEAIEKQNPAINHDRLLNASDSNQDKTITEAEADKALKNLDRYFSSNIQQLSKKEVEKRIEHFETASRVHFQPAKDPVSGVEKYGEVFNISVNGEPYQIVLIQKDKLEAAKINISFKHDLKGQYITDVSYAQANEILGAIEKDNPALKGKLGFFSMGETTNEGPTPEIFRMLDKTKIAENFGIEGTHVVSRRILGKTLGITTSEPHERGTEIVPYQPNGVADRMPGESGTSSRCAVMFGILVKTAAK